MADKTKADQVDEAKFLFIGTIKKLGASALAQVPKSAETAIVRVDEILHAPPTLAKTLGTQITVKLAKGVKPKVGDQVLFHAKGWVFGDTVAVESVKQDAPAKAKAMMGSTTDPTRNLKERELQNRVASADMVVEGEVSSVHLPESEMAAARAASSARPVSEHDPKWREAVVAVKAVHKGEPTTKQVVVRFPSSTDVQWYRAPKFHAGDRGVWVLKSPTESPVTGAAVQPKGVAALATTATAIPGAAVYTALSPLDFHSANQTDAVASVIRAAKNS